VTTEYDLALEISLLSVSRRWRGHGRLLVLFPCWDGQAAADFGTQRDLGPRLRLGKSMFVETCMEMGATSGDPLGRSIYPKFFDWPSQHGNNTRRRHAPRPYAAKLTRANNLKREDHICGHKRPTP